MWGGKERESRDPGKNWKKAAASPAKSRPLPQREGKKTRERKLGHYFLNRISYQ